MAEKGRKPLISVVMPAYNCEKFIEQAMESVFLQDVREDVELIVIDDASTDSTADTVKQYTGSKDMGGFLREVIYVKNARNLGVAESRNVGIRKARGRYLAFLDADDWWEAKKLRHQLPYLENGDTVLCYTGRELMNPDGTSIGKIIGVPKRVTYQKLLTTNSIPCSSVLLLTEVAREFYMCHDELHEDYIMWLRILKKYEFALGINEPFLKSRLSKGGKSRNKVKSAMMSFGVYRYMGIPVIKAIGYFISYVINGLLKYR